MLYDDVLLLEGRWSFGQHMRGRGEATFLEDPYSFMFAVSEGDLNNNGFEVLVCGPMIKPNRCFSILLLM